MINTIVPLEQIQFERVDVDPSLLESIRMRGIAIPVRVSHEGGFYRCVDGRKRLSACEVLGSESACFRRIPVAIIDDFSKAGSAYWGNTKRIH